MKPLIPPRPAIRNEETTAREATRRRRSALFVGISIHVRRNGRLLFRSELNIPNLDQRNFPFFAHLWVGNIAGSRLFLHLKASGRAHANEVCKSAPSVSFLARKLRCRAGQVKLLSDSYHPVTKTPYRSDD